MSNKDYGKKLVNVPVIVLGATGFIGRWVARSLCDARARVYMPVRDLASAKVILSEYGIEGEVGELDLLDTNGIRTMYRAVRPEITFNLAAYGVDPVELNEELAYKMNVDLIETLCTEISEIRNVDWQGVDIVNVGTAMEYGSVKGDLAENLEPKPTTVYGRTKLAGTRALKDQCSRYGVKGVTARLFSVYGPGESPNRLLPFLSGAARSSGPISLTAGLQRRDFTYVDDAAQGLLRLAERPLSGEAVNLATGVLSTVKEFVETAAETLGIDTKRLEFGALPKRMEEMDHDPVSILRLKEVTGWVPPTTISEGIRKTAVFCNDGRRPDSFEFCELAR